MATPSRPTWRHHFATDGGMYVTALTVFLVLGFVVDRGLDRFAEFRLQRQDVSEWVEYHDLAFVEEAPDDRGGLGALRLVSTLTTRRRVHLGFVDTLYCVGADTDAGFEFVSQNPETSSFVAEPEGRHETPWLYNADYPYGRRCRIESTITATIDDVEKVFQIQTPVFVVERPPD